MFIYQIVPNSVWNRVKTFNFAYNAAVRCYQALNVHVKG